MFLTTKFIRVKKIAVSVTMRNSSPLIAEVLKILGISTSDMTPHDSKPSTRAMPESRNSVVLR